MRKCRWDFVKIPCVIPSRTFSYVSFRGLTPESRSVMSHLVRVYCHSCASRNRGHVIDCFLYRHTVADVFVCVIPGPRPGIQVDRLARTRALCVACGLRPCRILRFAWIHSCAGRNRGHTVRANASHTRIIIFFIIVG